MIEKSIYKCKDFGKFPYKFRNKLLAEAFSRLEKEPRSLTDVNALIQTVLLKKFAISNNFIEKSRTQYREEIFDQLRKMEIGKDRIFKPSEIKYKYINKLFLLNGSFLSNNLAIQKKSPDTHSLSDSKEMQCNVNWPICLYDHTFKNRITSYLCFRTSSNLEIFDNYFQNTVLESDMTEQNFTQKKFFPGESTPKTPEIALLTTTEEITDILIKEETAKQANPFILQHSQPLQKEWTKKDFFKMREREREFNDSTNQSKIKKNSSSKQLESADFKN